MSNQIHHFQYADVKLTSDSHTFTYQKFIELTSPEDGLTDTEIHMHLWSMHQAKDKRSHEGLAKGFIWTDHHSAAAIFPAIRGNDAELKIVSSADPKIAHLMEVAPELFEYFW
jgi:hypothetical protein